MNTNELLRRLRRQQPINAVATSVVRSALRLTGRTSPKVTRHLHRVGHVREVLPNGRTLRLWSKGDDWVSNLVYWNRWAAYEPGSAELFFELSKDAGVVLDVGAYVGFFSLLAGHANPDARVFSFEPHPLVFERLQRHIALNGLDGVTAIRSAVGADDGVARFFTDPHSLPTSSGLSESFFAHTSHVEIEVAIIALDKFLDDRNVGRVGLIKIDTESTEAEVLKGMRKRLNTDRPYILCEVLPGSVAVGAISEILSDCQYVSFLVTTDGLVPDRALEGNEVFFNHLFVPAERRESIAGRIRTGLPEID